MSLLLLKEYASFDVKQEDIEIDDKDSGVMIVKGILQRGNTENHNERIYPLDILKSDTERYIKEKVETATAFGELNHSNSVDIDMERISHIIEKIWFENEVMYGKVKIIDSPKGQIVKAIIRAGGRPGISSRSIGSVKRKGNANVVQDNLRIICWDFVSEPSTPGAYMMRESVLKEARELTPEEIKFYNLSYSGNTNNNFEKTMEEIVSILKK